MLGAYAQGVIFFGDTLSENEEFGAVRHAALTSLSIPLLERVLELALAPERRARWIFRPVVPDDDGVVAPKLADRAARGGRRLGRKLTSVRVRGRGRASAAVLHRPWGGRIQGRSSPRRGGGILRMAPRSHWRRGSVNAMPIQVRVMGIQIHHQSTNHWPIIRN